MYSLSNFVRWEGQQLQEKVALVYTKKHGYFFVNTNERIRMELANELYILIGVEK